MFTNYIENLQQFDGGNIVNIVPQEPMCTLDGGNNEQSHNLPHIDDILDEIEDEEEYNCYLNVCKCL